MAKKVPKGKPVLAPKPKKKLTTLAAWNASRFEPEPEVHKNGIACPACNQELYDVDSVCHGNASGTFKRIACECGWSGERRV